MFNNNFELTVKNYYYSSVHATVMFLMPYSQVPKETEETDASNGKCAESQVKVRFCLPVEEDEKNCVLNGKQTIEAM